MRLAGREEVRKAVFSMKRFGRLLQSRKAVFGMARSQKSSSAPETANYFRPITLLNVVFKIISKVLVNRMRPIMSKLVGPFQNSFLPGRSTMDNVILNQEIMHSMRHKKGRKGYMMIKIDLHKAHDSLDWGFLKSVLAKLGFSDRFVRLVMFALKENRISIN